MTGPKIHYVVTHSKHSLFKLAVRQHDPKCISKATVSIQFPVCGHLFGEVAGFGGDYLRGAFEDALAHSPKFGVSLYAHKLKAYESLKERSSRIAAGTSKAERSYQRTLEQIGSEQETLAVVKRALIVNPATYATEEGNALFPFKELLEAQGFTVTRFMKR